LSKQDYRPKLRSAVLDLYSALTFLTQTKLKFESAS
jgi:hypothetical protein